MKRTKLVLTGMVILMCSMLAMIAAAVRAEWRHNTAHHQQGNTATHNIMVGYPAGLFKQ